MAASLAAPEPVVPAYRTLKLPRKYPQVLGAGLNCSEIGGNGSHRPVTLRLSRVPTVISPTALDAQKFSEPLMITEPEISL
jgi:hypothetical protein